MLGNRSISNILAPNHCHNRMSGRHGRYGRSGGRGAGRNNQQRNFSGRGSSRGSFANREKGLTPALNNNIFTYGEKNSADKLRQSWEELAVHCGATMGTDIQTELHTGKEFVIPRPEYSQQQKDAHQASETKRKAQQARILAAYDSKKKRLEALVKAGSTRQAAEEDVLAGEAAQVELAGMLNEIDNIQDEIDTDKDIELKGQELEEWKAEWKAYQDRKIKLEQARGKAFAKLKGQCTKNLLEELKSDADYDNVMASNNALELRALMEKVIMGQSDDTYPFAVIYNQEQSVYGIQQNNLNDDQWYDTFNTRVDVARSAGVTWHCAFLLDSTAQDIHQKKYDELTPEQQEAIKIDAEERYLAYVFLKQSGAQHKDLKKELKNDYLKAHLHKGSEGIFPKTRSEVLKLLNTYKGSAPGTKTQESHGGSFLQKGSHAKGKQGKKPFYDKEYWSDKTCNRCGELGHPGWSGACEPHNKKKQKKQDDDKSTRSSKSSSSIAKMQKKIKQVGKTFANLKKDLEQIKEDESDLSDSDSESEDGDEDEASYLNFSMPTPKAHKKAQQIHNNNGGINRLDMRKVILLDNESTTHLYCNSDLVTDIHTVKNSMTVKGNGGKLQTHKKAVEKDLQQKVWFSKNAVTNILSLAKVAELYQVTYDSGKSTDFVVHREDHGLPNMTFKLHPCGLHIYDPYAQDKQLNFVQTVAGNMEGFTKREIARAEKAGVLYIRLIYPSGKDFDWAVMSNQIEDCDVTPRDVEVARKIWGPNVAALKGKTTRTTPKPVQGVQLKIPRDIMNMCKEVLMYADIFFVNKIPFLITLSAKLDFTAGYHLANRTVNNIFKAFLSVYKFYLRRGFRIVTVRADGEFAPLQEKINEMPNGPRVNLTNKNEHVPQIERRIKVVKERVRAAKHGMPFSHLPKLLVIHTVLTAIRMLTFFPTKGGISEVWSPMMLLHGRRLNFKKDLALALGDYCQIHEEDTPRNSMKARTQGAICLGPTGSDQGGYKFLTLKHGTKVTRRSWTKIPMPDGVIDRVNFLGKDQPEDLIFYDRHGNPLGEVDITGVDEQELEPETQAENDLNPQQELQELDQLENADDGELGDQEIDIQPEEEAESPGVRRSGRIKFQTRADYVPSMTGSKYAFAATQLEDHGVLHPDLHLSFLQHMIEQEPDTVAVIMTQLSLKAGLKTWGKEANDAAYMEMKQLHFRDTFNPVHFKDLTNEQKQKILRSHLFLKKKRDTGKIKGRTVANGSEQRPFMDTTASSPTVSTEAVMLTSIIEALERRDIVTIDIPNAFIQTKIENEKDRVIIRISGVLVDMLLKIAPGVYDEYVTIDKRGEKQLLCECLNAIYGTCVASFLYYSKFCRTLKREGFVQNPYDPCVWNRQVDASQQTICFHVDDCKLSHIDPKVNQAFVETLRKEYESIFEDGSGKMKVHTGKVHEFLGMTLDYSEEGIVKVSMPKYMKEVLAEFERIMPKEKGTKSSAAPANLFVLDKDCEQLDKEKAEQYHSLVAKMLFATKRARPDTGTAMSYLMTRTSQPNKDDWEKLAHMMKYVRGTEDLVLILSANGSGLLKWWIDGSYAVHWNMRGHTGGGISMGRGFPIFHSGKQKLNTRSSTETEVVGVDDLMPAILWTRMFLEAQDYGVKENIIYQDNQAAMLLEKNGKASSGKRTKHIAIRYFFVTDRIAKGDVSIDWCPTEDMTADFWTKPLQGALFRRFRDLIMGVMPQPDPRKTKPTSKSKTKKNSAK